jgi:hypothetical protein
MRTHHRGVFLFALAGVFLVGCQKEVKLSFINTTSQSRELELSAPGHGTMYLGRIGATGGRITHKLKIDEDYLPARCSWRAGDRADAFVINKESRSDLRIMIDPTGNIGPIDNRTSIEKKERTQADNIIIRQEMVVE